MWMNCARFHKVRPARPGSQQPFNLERLHGRGNANRPSFESPPTTCDLDKSLTSVSLLIPSVNGHENTYLTGLLLRESTEAVFL